MTGSNREFVYEASNQIERLSDGFVQLQRKGFDRGTLDDLFRHAHTLKGNCSAEGFAEPAETAHALEDLLDSLRGHPDAFDDSYVDTALEGLDVLERQLTELQTTGSVDTNAADVVRSIRDLMPEPEADSTTTNATADPAPGLAIDDIEMPAVSDGEDVSVEEALDNASVFDDLEELEGSVDADEFDAVEGVGLFDAEDEANDGTDEASAATDAVSDATDAASDATDAASDATEAERASIGTTAGEASGAKGESAGRSTADRGEKAAASGIRSSTRLDSEVVPGEDSYAEMLSDTTLADPADLQSELEDVTFGEFDDDDDLSIDELVDLAEDSSADAVDADTFALDDSSTDDGWEDATASAADSGGERLDESEFSGAEAVDSAASESVEEDTPFEFGTTIDPDSAARDAGGAERSEGSGGETETVVESSGLDRSATANGSNGANDTNDTTDATEANGATDATEANGATDASDVDAGAGSNDGRGAAADSAAESVADIVDRIERLDDSADDAESDHEAHSDESAEGGRESHTDESAEGGRESHADDVDGDDGVEGGESGEGADHVTADAVTIEGLLEGSDPSLDEVSAGGDGGSGADDAVGAAFDAAAEAGATPDEPDVLPSDVPDVDSLLEETSFEDVDEVEFATAAFYDRVGFETDSSTGAFVSEFGEAFEDDATGFDSNSRAVEFDAASTIEPALLDAEPAVDDGEVSSMETVREVTLDVEAADDLLELTEELVVDTQRLAGALGDLPPEAADALASLRDVSRRIEDHVSNVRLVPLDEAFKGLSRTSRRVARDQDKEVTFLTENGSIEVDRRVVDELADPLVHLVRNAVDHGIEPPEERVSRGKNPEGTVLVRAERTGDTVTVAVEDDGRGVDPDDLRAAAVEEGMYAPAEAKALSRNEALELMFDAGLSTTDTVTEVSGRGVGMDVVSDVVTRLEGTLDVESEPGVGTTIELTLPVSVALSDVLTVAVGSRRFGLPATDVRRVEEFVPERVHGDDYHLLAGEAETERVPIIDLAATLDVTGDSSAGRARTDVLVLTDAPEPRAYRCQDVLDWEAVVLQPFDGVLADHALVRGAALVGDGSPVVVLEPAALGGDR